MVLTCCGCGLLTNHLAKFLFNYQTTPHATTGVTLAELLMGVKICKSFSTSVEEHQVQQKHNYDTCTRRHGIQPGEGASAHVSAQGDQWETGYGVTDRACLHPNSSECSNVVWRRHITTVRPCRQLRAVCKQPSFASASKQPLVITHCLTVNNALSFSLCTIVR